MDAALLVLLRQTTKVLLDAAKYYVVSNSKTALKAREAVSEDSVGHEPFHAAIHGRLSALQGSIEASERSVHLELAVTTIRQTLDTFEALVSSKDSLAKTSDPSGTSYAGLQRLQVMYSADAASKRRPKPLGYRKFLFCPPTEIRIRLKNDIAACSNVLSRSTEGHGDPDILSDLETIREWRVPPGMLRQATRVREVLLQHWSCPCAKKHNEVKLAFTASPKTASATGVVGCYKLSWPVKEGSESTHFSPWLHLVSPATGIERVSENVRPAKSGGKGVRFAIEDDSYTSEQRTAYCTGADLHDSLRGCELERRRMCCASGRKHGDRHDT